MSRTCEKNSSFRSLQTHPPGAPPYVLPGRPHRAERLTHRTHRRILVREKNYALKARRVERWSSDPKCFFAIQRLPIPHLKKGGVAPAGIFRRGGGFSASAEGDVQGPPAAEGRGAADPMGTRAAVDGGQPLGGFAIWDPSFRSFWSTMGRDCYGTSVPF